MPVDLTQAPAAERGCHKLFPVIGAKDERHDAYFAGGYAYFWCTRQAHEGFWRIYTQVKHRTVERQPVWNLDDALEVMFGPRHGCTGTMSSPTWTGD